MSITALTGPVVTFADDPLGKIANTNPDQGPSLFLQGYGLLDPRLPFTFSPGGAPSQKAYGWFGSFVQTLDQAPSAISAVNISVAAVPTAGVALGLVAASGAGITVPVSINRADTGALVTGLLAIDLAMGSVGFGQSGTMQTWDPTKAVSRAIRITSVGNDSTATFTVKGFDLYGYPMTETITGANAGIATGKKAWKYITSIIPAVTLSGSAVSVGTSDVIGLPLRADFFCYTELCYNNTWITTNTGFTVADSTSPATALTGDVRGTYLLQSASDGTKRIQGNVSPSVANLGTTAGILGVTQF